MLHEPNQYMDASKVFPLPARLVYYSAWNPGVYIFKGGGGVNFSSFKMLPNFLFFLGGGNWSKIHFCKRKQKTGHNIKLTQIPRIVLMEFFLKNVMFRKPDISGYQENKNA